MKTLRLKLIVYFSLILFSVALYLSLYYYETNKNLFRENLIENAENNLEYIQSNINKVFVRCESFSDYIYLDRSIGRFLVRDYSHDEKDYYNLDLDISEAIRSLKNRIDNDSISSYVNSILIQGRNGKTIKYGPDSDYFNIPELDSEKWFSENKSQQTVTWIGIQKNNTMIPKDEYMLPLVRTVISPDTHKITGWQFISFSTEIISQAFEDFEFKQRDIIIVYDQNHNCIHSNRGGLQGKQIPLELRTEKETKNHMIHYEESQWLMVENTSSYTGYSIVQLVDYQVLAQQNRILLKSTLLILAALVTAAIFMTWFLSNNLTKPLKRIEKKMLHISDGDFTRDPDLETKGEIGILGRGINDLAENVNLLLEKIRDEEMKKRELEFKTLQSQINPHFVYNMLNSLRIMAELHGAPGIQEVVVNFGELLKEVSKGVDDKVLIEKEFELLERYIYIQKIRKKGLIRAEYQIEETCRSCLILKFLLQPLVENAIIHGLEGKKGMGYLWIRAGLEGEKLCISIRDNGVGISDEEKERIFQKRTIKGSHYNNIGVKNIQERIQLLYGKEYGLSYESKPGEYTIVKVLLPKEEKEDADVQSTVCR